MSRSKLIVLVSMVMLSCACASNGEKTAKKAGANKSLSVEECVASGSRMGRRC